MKFLLALLAVSAFAACKPKTMQVFLLVGQSNMAGRGIVEDQDRTPMGGVFSLSQAMQWVPAVDPLHFDKPKIAGVGMGRSFAKVLADRSPGVKIGLVPAAFGGTSLEQWKPGSPLYTDAVKRARFAIQSGPLRGILWHQGESDSGSNSTAETYAERWVAFAAQLRSDLNAPDVPILVGALGPFLSSAREPFASIVNEQLESLPKRMPHVVFIPATGLRANPDNLHFDAPSQREFGKRYAQAYLRMQKDRPCR